MKKHNFEQAISIFKGMFEGWIAVTKRGDKLKFVGFDVVAMKIHTPLEFFEDFEISHLEQTLPMNGDEVWAWDVEGQEKRNLIYIGK